VRCVILLWPPKEVRPARGKGKWTQGDTSSVSLESGRGGLIGVRNLGQRSNNEKKEKKVNVGGEKRSCGVDRGRRGVKSKGKLSPIDN